MGRSERWCGICFQWREEREGRCVACGNAHMTGARLPLPRPVGVGHSGASPVGASENLGIVPGGFFDHLLSTNGDKTMGQSVCPGQRVVLDACPGYDINNNVREFYGEWLVDHVNPCEVGLVPRHPDRYANLEDQTVFVDLPLPPAHHFWIDSDA